MVFNKKAISPIVATALLLIVAVLAVVGFQTWFMAYQSGVNAKVEQESQTSSIFSVERVEADGTVYVKNNGVEPLNVRIKIPKYDTDCPETNHTVNGTSVYAMELSCTTDMAVSDKIDVIVIAPSGVFQSTQIVRE